MATNVTGIQYNLLSINIVVNRVIVKTEINVQEQQGINKEDIMKTSKG